MSTKYTGGFITKSPVAPTTTAASGIWTLDQQQQAQKAGTWPSQPVFIEDVFSTWLYTGTSASQTINNGIDLASKGGLTWFKNRNNTQSHYLIDSARGISKVLNSNYAYGQGTDATIVTSYNSNGFTVEGGDVNFSTYTYASWTFREQPKFFDIVTYTGTGVARAISHNLGSVPGCMIVKKTSGTENWLVYHRGLGSPDSNGVQLNTTAGQQGPGITSYWNNTLPTSTQFTVGTNDLVNQSGATYVAYLFAHDAGGFGLTGTDNVISCGSFTIDGSGKFTVNLGYEPQWIMIKLTNFESNWSIFDNMRGMPVGSPTTRLLPNLTDAESSAYSFVDISATGFAAGTGSGNPYSPGQTWIYIAIRRGPMKTPTVGTSVFTPNTATYSANQVVTTGFPVDMLMMKGRTISYGNLVEDRLRGLASTNTSPVNPQLLTTTPDGETAGDYTNTANNTGYQISPGFSGFSSVNWNFGRAPGFMDVVCYTGTGVQGRTVAHNLIVAPEFIIVKARDKVENFVGWSLYGPTSGSDVLSGNLNDTNLFSYTRIVGIPTTTTFAVSSNGETNAAGYNYVAYLFATLAGVSKVGSYTGTGAAQTINCGFTTGARFVLIKCTSSNATNWNVWDSARGIIPANDPYLSINLAAGEVTGTDYIDTTNVGFDITSTAPAEVNGNGSSFIFLAIA